MSLGAFRGETLIGVAQCLATATTRPTAEVALAVAHAEQANGVGTLLLDHLASRARRSGVRRFVAEVLAENDRVRQVLADVGLPVRRWVEDGQVQVEFDLDPAGGYLDALAAREERADVASLTAVLAPRSVVVVGAGRRHRLSGPRGAAQPRTGRLSRSPRCREPTRRAGVRRGLPPVGGRADRSRSTWRCCAFPRRRCRRWPSSAGAEECARCS